MTKINRQLKAAVGNRKLLSVHNNLSAENIPIENFLRLDDRRYSLHALSLLQSGDEAREFVARVYPECSAAVHGMNHRRQPFASLWRLARTLWRERPDIVHLNHGLSGFLAGLLARCTTRARVVTTLHNDFRTFRWRHKVLLMAAMCFSHMIVCNSQSTLESLGRWRRTLLRWKRFRVCYNGVNAEKVAAQRLRAGASSGDEPSQPFRIGFIGRLVPQKDIPTLLRGFAEFHVQRPDSRLLIGGDGPLRGELQQLAETLGVDEAIEFKGLLSRDEAYRLLAKVDVAVISSRWEGFCNAMVEAMFAGKPIIATDIDVLQEVLSRECGLFFPVGRHQQLARNMLALHDDAALRTRLGEAAHQRAVRNFSIDACAEGYSHCYREIMDGPAASRKAA